MNAKSIFNLLLLISIAFFSTTVAFSQTITQPEPSPALEEAAKAQVKYWENELSLTAKQFSLMEDKIIEFVFKKDKILQSNLEETEKSRQLIQLKALENKDMRDILTKPQFDRYIMLQEEMIKEQNAENK